MKAILRFSMPMLLSLCSALVLAESSNSLQERMLDRLLYPNNIGVSEKQLTNLVFGLYARGFLQRDQMEDLLSLSLSQQREALRRILQTSPLPAINAATLITNIRATLMLADQKALTALQEYDVSIDKFFLERLLFLLAGHLDIAALKNIWSNQSDVLTLSDSRLVMQLASYLADDERVPSSVSSFLCDYGSAISRRIFSTLKLLKPTVFKQALPEKRPTHIAVIMDGNHRWAKSHSLPSYAGYVGGLAALRETVASCLGAGVPYLTVFAFSRHNWQRPEEQIRVLLGLGQQLATRHISEMVENGVRLRFIGERKGLSNELITAMNNAEEESRHGNRLTLSVAVNYTGRWDILQAAQQLRGRQELSEQEFGQLLSTAETPDPDLLIRTSGEMRISDFLLWQMANTEYWFPPMYWPDFDTKAFVDALKVYDERDRRFGQTSAGSTAYVKGHTGS